MAALKRILLAEDNANDIELTLSALAEHNLANEVVVVRDGVEAWDFLRKSGSFAKRDGANPAVILADLKMPRMDGLELLKRIRTDERFHQIPVVVLTSSREESDVIESYAIGANAYVVKPVAFHEFIEAVKSLGLFWAVLNEPPPDRGRAPVTA